MHNMKAYGALSKDHWIHKALAKTTKKGKATNTSANQKPGKNMGAMMPKDMQGENSNVGCY